MRQALDSYNLTGFKFEKVILGQVPPRVTGIKVYDKNVDRNEIILDLDIVFASDAEVKFSLKGISAKISDFSLKGNSINHSPSYVFGNHENYYYQTHFCYFFTTRAGLAT